MKRNKSGDNMYALDRGEEEQALSKIIESKGLPVTVSVTRTCTLRDEPVITEGQSLTILDKQWVHLMYGKNWDDKTFRIKIANIKEEQLQLVEEFYVIDSIDMKEVSKKCKYVQLKLPFVHKFYEFDKCDKFVFNYSPENPETISLTSIRLGVTFSIPSSIVYDFKRFVFVKPGQKLSINDFVKLSPFRPVSAEFERKLPHLPQGIVRIDELPIYETILTVTRCNNSRIKYEFFPLHLAIPGLCMENLFLPKQLPRDAKSPEYKQKIQEVEFVMHFDIYEARFYGSVEYEDELRTLPFEASSKAQKNSLIRKSKSFSDFDSITDETPIYDAKSFDVPREKKKRSPSVFSSFRNKLQSPSREKSKSVMSKSKSFIKEDVPEHDEPREVFRYKETCDLKSYKKTSPSDKGTAKLSSPSRDNIESVNELYGKLSLSRPPTQIGVPSNHNPRKLSPTDVQPLVSIKSAQFSDKDFRIRKTSTPLSFDTSRQKVNLASTRRAFSVSPTDVQRDWENSPPKYEKPTTLNLVKSYSVEIEVPLGARKQSFQEKQRRRTTTPEAILSNNDSGIDSPEGRKSTENLARSCDVASMKKLFEKNSSIISVKSERSDLRNRSSSESKIIDSPFTEHHANENRPKSMFSDNFYESVNYADMKNSFRLKDPLKQKEVDSLRVIKAFDGDQVISMLRELNMNKYEGLFKTHQADGVLITDLTETGFREMNMTPFDARKLYKYIHGWRAMKKSSVQTVALLDASTWSVLDVYDSLKKIHLDKAANFFLHNVVDGELLLEIVDADIVKTMTEINLNSFEIRKLYKYVHGWRPNNKIPSPTSTESNDAMSWSVEYTFEVLKKINLDRLGKFCLDNQVDGALLVDLIDTNLISNLPEVYGLKLIEIEAKRLQRQVNKQVDSKFQGYF